MRLASLRSAQLMLNLRSCIGKVKEKYGEKLSQERSEVLELGGLYVMGTSRHESKRIDQQLRGRSGRQGDPGSSRFFLSFEDEIFRVFGGDKMTKFLEVFRVADNMPIEAPNVVSTLDKVQGSVEENFAGVRENVFKFDQVLNSQREVVYDRRQAILFSGLGGGEGLCDLLKEYCKETISDIVRGNLERGGGLFFPRASSSFRTWRERLIWLGLRERRKLPGYSRRRYTKSSTNRW